MTQIVSTELKTLLTTDRLEAIHASLVKGINEYRKSLASLSNEFHNQVTKTRVFQDLSLDVFDVIRQKHNNRNDLRLRSNLKKFEDWNFEQIHYAFIEGVLSELMTKFPQSIPIIKQYAEST